MSSRNVGWRDAGIRGSIGLVLLLISATLQDRPFLALGAGFMGLILIGTGLFRTCPVYTLLRVNTCASAAPRRS